MSEEFTQGMLGYFGADVGAYSIVTKDEFRKSQITFVGPEQKIAEEYLGDRIEKNHGSIKNIKAAGVNPEIGFKKFPDGETINLTVSYKTNKPRELRYYLRVDTFKPKAGDFWGIFVREQELWICHFSEWMLGEINSGRLKNTNRNFLLEPEIDDYQETINSGPPNKIKSSNFKWGRNPHLAAQALQSANYNCELFPNMQTFISKHTNKAFQEAHHLVPMKEQERFDQSLDQLDNICVLGPFGHRRIHHAHFDVIVPDLKMLISKRAPLLERLDLVADDIIGLYR